MARFLLFLCLLVPVVVAGNWLVDHPGTVTVQWMGLVTEMHVALLALLMLGVCVTITLLVLLLWQLASWPERRRARQRYRHLARGLSQLTHGVSALALGDESTAEASLRKALHYLPDEPLPHLLTAQLLQRQGQQEAARAHLRLLLKHESTAQLAAKRLIEQHYERQEWDAATQLAEQMYAEHRQEHWLIVTLIDLYARVGNTGSMLGLSEGFQWKSPLARHERHHYAALAYFLRSQHAENSRAERTALRHAVGFDAEFLPATVNYATLLVHEREPRAARKLLLAAWRKHPTRLLIDPILHSISAAAPRAQERYLKSFYASGEHYPHWLLRAEHAVMQGDDKAAAAALHEALALEETREVCALMADVEKRLHGEEAANRWLARAMQAPHGAVWQCQACGSVHAQWQAHCSQCGRFDSMQFARPESRVTSVEVATA